MTLKLYEEENIQAIADAIRGKNGSQDLYKPREMAAAIDAIEGKDLDCNGMHVPEEVLVISGNCQYRFYRNSWNWVIDLCGDKINTENMNAASNMFDMCDTLGEIPFELNFDRSKDSAVTNLFSGCKKIKNVPAINNLRPQSTTAMFTNCACVKEIPEGFSDSWDWSYMESLTSMYSGSRERQFQGCSSLRKFPMEFLNHGNPNVYYSYSIYGNCFHSCHALDEIIGLPFPHLSSTWTSNAFNSTFAYCGRTKDITFAMQDNATPYEVNWKSQTIDLTTYLGYSNSSAYLTSYNSGITADKEVTDDASYQALKDDADWFTIDVAYSRYNHDSAVRTIQSLPDTSAYLATAGGTNTIKFKGDAGSKTDGGAINTLTEEEIAVATVKGWAVTFT